MKNDQNKENSVKEAKIIMWSMLFLLFALPILFPPVLSPPIISREGDQEIQLTLRILGMLMMFYLLFPPFHRKQLLTEEGPVKLALIRCAVAFAILGLGVYQIFP